MKLILAAAALVLSHTSAFAASPAVSRGEVLLSIPFEECMARAYASFKTEGFVVEDADNTSYVLARKATHTAYITCSPAPQDQVWANVFVSSWTADKKIPGAERMKLQAHMAEPAARGNFAGNWVVTKDWGALTITQNGDKASGRYLTPAGNVNGFVYGDTMLLDFKDDAGAEGRVYLHLTSAKTFDARWCPGQCNPKASTATFTGRRR